MQQQAQHVRAHRWVVQALLWAVLLAVIVVRVVVAPVAAVRAVLVVVIVVSVLSLSSTLALSISAV